ncbi:MAG TPA: helix-turn-helix transcriptional regulator [Sphingobacterium sp.]|nr:helix-turn-helix transcriptional regulator [Sphingobacterium sp.]
MEKQAIHDSIKNARKAKGMTQQDLAETSGLSLRTIQRIEKGNSEISGYSLKQISNILEIPLEKLIMTNVEHIKIETAQSGSIKALYLSSLTFLVNPVFGIVLPVILYYNKTNRTPAYRKHFRFILYYMIISTALVFGTVILMMAQRIMEAEAAGFVTFMSSKSFRTIFAVYYIGTTILMLYQFFAQSRTANRE